MKKLLIITPTLGNSSFLSETIKSVELFASEALHVLVAPLSKVEAIKRAHPRVTVLAERIGTKSLYDAVNQIVASMGGDYSGVSYINDDDVLCEGFKRLVSVWSNALESGVFYGRVAYLNPRGRVVGFIPIARWRWQVCPLISSARMPLAQQGLIIDFDVWNRIGGFDLRYSLCADMCLLRDAAEQGADFYYVDAYVAGFRLHADQLSKSSGRMQAESVEIGRSILGLRAKLSRLAYAFFILQNISVYLFRVFKNGLKRSWEISDNAQ